MKRLKVLSISHTAHSEGSGRLRYLPFAGDARLELKIVIPDRWRQDGADRPFDPVPSDLDMVALPIRLPHVRGVKWYAHVYSGLGALIKEFQPDVIHLWEEPWSLVALQAAILRRRLAPRSALLLETDQNILRRLPPPFERVRRYLLRQTDWLLSRHDEATAVSRACGYTGGVTLIGYCVDRSVFNVAGISKRERTHDRAAPLRVGYVGRLIREKGLFTVLDAMRLATSAVTFTLVGGGSARSDLETHASQIGLGDRVIFLPSQGAAAVGELMKSFDVLVLMSETTATWKEQFGRVILEAQACGTPVIGSTSGSIPSVVGEGGWIVPEGDAAALAQLFDRLAADPSLIDRAAARALANVEHYTPEAVAESLYEAFAAGAGAVAAGATASAGGAAQRQSGRA